MIDLHTHSTASDGTLTPAALLDCAAGRGLVGLALTDHDTLAGLEEARAQAGRHGIAFLAGIELSTRLGELDAIHLLGYFPEGPLGEELPAACNDMAAARARRAGEMVARLNAAGVAVSLEAVRAEAGIGVIGRPHLARALVAGGWAGGIGEAFQRWLVPGRPGYLPHARLSTLEAIGMLRRAGGVAVLAHPGTLGLTPRALEALVGELKRGGLGGLEAYWARHAPEQVALCERLAVKLKLVATGGSDFHGANKPDLELGMAAGGRRLGLEMFAALAAQRPAGARSEPGARGTSSGQ